MKYNIIVSALMSLHTSENVRCFFKCERLDFSIFWHHQEQSPDLTSGYVLKLTSNHKFSINHAVNWNLGFGSVETFRSFFQNNLNIFWHFFLFFGHFCMTENGITTKLTYVFSVISKQRRSVTEKSPKKNRLKHSQGKCFWFFGQLH